MIFGRKKRDQSEELAEDIIDVDETERDDELVDDDLADDEVDEDVEDVVEDDADDDDADEDDVEADGESVDAEPATDEEIAADPAAKKWSDLDASQDWREDGPFDIEEVDLDADDVQRLDFESLVVTPFDGMGMQLQVNQATGDVQAILAAIGSSAIEVSLFAAPAQTSMLEEIRTDMVAAAAAAGGSATMAEGPFGTEIRRLIPMQDAEGNPAYHISRTWFAHGPKWLLRGVVMGEAGVSEGIDGVTEVLYEFFSNCVVRRDSSPRVPGELIGLKMPEGLQAPIPGAES